MEGSSIYKLWAGMIQRCYNPNTNRFKNYGGRGIEVCERWRDFRNFYNDMGLKPKGMSLDRIDNNKGYSPENCRWSSHTIQARNKGLSCRNKTGIKGVSLTKNGMFYAYIGVNKKLKGLGTFKTLEEAKEVRKKAELKYWK